MSAAEGKRFHEDFLRAINTKEEDFVNGFINPSMRTVSYWYSMWKEKNPGRRNRKSGVIEVTSGYLSEHSYRTLGMANYVRSSYLSTLFQ